MRCRGGLGYHKRSNVVRGWFQCLRREDAEGGRQPEMVLPGVKNGRGSPSPWLVGGTEPWGACLVGCIGSFQVGCRGRREEAATLTPPLQWLVVGEVTNANYEHCS